MTGAPLPPHERAWRHPSEVGRAVHEPPTGRSHAIMVTTAAVGLLMVALLVVAITPGGAPGDVAAPGAAGAPITAGAAPPPVTTALALTVSTPVVSVESPVVAASIEPMIDTAVATAWTVVGTVSAQIVDTVQVTTTELIGTAASTVAAVTVESMPIVTVAASDAPDSTLPPLETDDVVVPIDRGVALMTQPDGASVAAGESVVAALPSGVEITVVVIAADEAGLVVVSVPENSDAMFEPASPDQAAPAPHDTVEVHADGGGLVTLGALAGLDVPDGTPITGADGELVGLCDEDHAGATTMMVIDRARVDAIGG